ncbi:MAG: glycoside hydrolase family 5 protein, partial [Chitinispirillaceae bacterium]
MKTIKKCLMASVMPVLLCAASLFAQQRQSPVEMYGKLRVDGTKIVSESGEDTVQLMGMSLYWSVWGGEEFYNRDVVSWLVEDWNIDVIRASMSVD